MFVYIYINLIYRVYITVVVYQEPSQPSAEKQQEQKQKR